jgi:ABC-type polysaccharide/polyol phosphate export permease
MHRRDLLLSIICGRMLFIVPELVIVLGVGVWLFGIRMECSLFPICLIALAGAVGFAGLGLLLASRADRIETITGLTNMISLPMWLFCGAFFSYERFPDALQPFIQILPLTHLIDALRAVILEGQPLVAQWTALIYLFGMGVVCFLLALRRFRWT